VGPLKVGPRRHDLGIFGGWHGKVVGTPFIAGSGAAREEQGGCAQYERSRRDPKSKPCLH